MSANQLSALFTFLAKYLTKLVEAVKHVSEWFEKTFGGEEASE